MSKLSNYSRTTTIVLFLLAAFIVAERLWAYDKPIRRDVSIYAVIGHELLGGRWLYSDLLELRPPAVLVTYAAGEAFTGYGRHTLFLLYVIPTIITLFGVYYAGSAGGGATAGLWAATFWAVLSGSYGLEGGEPNTEVFMNACLAWAFALWVRYGETSNDLKRSLAIGALFALASLYKHMVVVCPLLLATTHVAFPSPERRDVRLRRSALVDVAVIAAVGVGVWALVTGYFAATGRFGVFRETMIGSSLAYAADGNKLAIDRPDAVSVLLRNVTAPLRGKVEFFPDMLNPLAILTGLGGAVGLFRNHRQWALLLAFGVATWLCIATPGQFWIHYYQLWLPPLVVGTGWTIASIGSFATKRRLNWLPHAVGGVVLSLLVWQQLPFYRMNAAGDWTPFDQPEEVISEPLAREIDSLLAPGETFYEWGGFPSLYFHSKRRPPSGILMVWWFVQGRLSARLSPQVIADLERAQPELLVVQKTDWPEDPADNPVSSWLQERYYPLPGGNERGPYSLYVRRGGRLEVRLQSTLK